MKVSYKRHIDQSYMKIQTEESRGELLELTMLAYNKIPGLVSMETEISDGEVCFWYNITGMQSLRDYLNRKAAGEDILTLLLVSLEKIFQEVKQYFLPEEGILLKQEHIYLDFTNQKMEFIYLPSQMADVRENFRILMEELLRKVNHTDRQGTSLIYEIYQLSLEKELSLRQMIQQAMQTEERTKLWEKPSYEPDVMVEEEAVFMLKDTEKERKSKWKQQVEELAKMQFEKLTAKIRKEKKEELFYVEEEEEKEHPTELLNSGQVIQGMLQYQGRGNLEDIYINKENFFIGKQKKEVDAHIDNSGVSRVHARIEKQKDAFYIEDLNSTNGTYINGERLEYREQIMLEIGDRIVFGEEEYVFL